MSCAMAAVDQMIPPTTHIRCARSRAATRVGALFGGSSSTAKSPGLSRLFGRTVWIRTMAYSGEIRARVRALHYLKSARPTSRREYGLKSSRIGRCASFARHGTLRHVRYASDCARIDGWGN
jgi:hypothetical protein